MTEPSAEALFEGYVIGVELRRSGHISRIDAALDAAYRRGIEDGGKLACGILDQDYQGRRFIDKIHAALAPPQEGSS
jgi:hypothetical protein